MYACVIPLALWAAFKFTIKPVDPDLESESVRLKIKHAIFKI